MALTTPILLLGLGLSCPTFLDNQELNVKLKQSQARIQTQELLPNDLQIQKYPLAMSPKFLWRIRTLSEEVPRSHGPRQCAHQNKVSYNRGLEKNWQDEIHLESRKISKVYKRIELLQSRLHRVQRQSCAGISYPRVYLACLNKRINIQISKHTSAGS